MAKKKSDDDISLDFSGMKKFFKKVNVTPQRAVMLGLIVLAMVIVFAIRMMPASLPATEQWADQSIQNGIRTEVQNSIDRQFPALPQESKNKLINEQVAEYLSVNGPQLEATRDQLSENFKTRLQYTAENGKNYAYLGDLDSYFWLRYTRNWLDTGMVCEEIVDGKCRSTYIQAPVGGSVDFNPSLHVFAIGWLYKFITFFNPLFPLLATSFLIPVLIGTLGVIPAFFIGRRLAGNVGGFFAAILISLHPLLLSRSMGSDNDVWNVVLPLFIMWMAIEALEAKDTKWRIIYGALAGVFVAIHAATWAGWWFIYLIILLAMIGYFLFQAVRYVIRKKSYTIWKDKSTVAAFIVLIVFYISALLFTSVFAGDETPLSYMKKPLIPITKSADLGRAVAGEYWPNVLTTVAELNRSSLGGAINQMGGKLFFFFSLTGLLLMILPRHWKKWRWEHYTLLSVGALIYLYLLNGNLGSFWLSELITQRFAVLFLLGLPIAIVLLLDLFRGYKIDVAVAVVVLVWFIATVYATYSGIRFILLMIPAFGAAFAVTAGRVFEWVNEYVRKEISWKPFIITAIIFLIFATALVQPVMSGYRTAYGFVPTIDDAWWDSLTKIKNESEPDAIINSWWDFGHWFKYVADRRVTADGTTQHTHIPRWLGLSLITPDERESMGVLRMLDCGSDAYPGVEGDLGAYGKTRKIVEDPIVAHDIVKDISNLDRDEADDYLKAKDFTQEQRDDILTSSHCEPPENYFITSGDMTGKAGVWAHFGLWDFRKAYIVQHAKEMSRDEAVLDFTTRFDYTESEAEDLYFRAKGLSDEGARNAFVSPWPGYVTQSWRGGCTEIKNGTAVRCPLGVGVGQQGNSVTAIDNVIFNLSSLNESYMNYGLYQGGQRLGQNKGTPGMIIIAGNDSMDEYSFSGATSPGLGILYDEVRGRVLLGDPHLLRSVYTQLFYLDGRYNQYFDKFSDQSTITGSRVIIWKVDWDGKP